MRRTVLGRTTTLRATALGVLAALTLSACALDAGEQVQPPAAVAPQGGSAVIGIPRPGSIDPGNAYEPVGTMISGLLCDTLIDVDRETGELVPAIAESWQVTGDGEAIILRLREGVRFHDGTEVTAEDVVYSLSRAASAEFAGDAADLLAPIEGFEAIRGQDPDAPQRQRERLAGIQALTGRTVQITLQDQRANTIALLTHPVTAPVSRDAVETDPDGFRSQPVCAGPYRLAEPWDPETDAIRLERFEDHYAGNAAYTGGGAGYLDEITFRVIGGLGPTTVPESGPSPSATASAPDAEPAPEVAPPSLADLDAALVTGARASDIAGEPGLTLVGAPGPGMSYVGLPFQGPERDAPADPGSGEVPDLAPTAGAEEEQEDTEASPDAVLRRALSRSLDRETIASKVFSGDRVPATSFLPTTLGTVWSRPSPCGAALPPSGDAEGARRLLDEAGISLEGQQLELTFNDELRNRKLVQAVAAQWENALGVQVKLTALSWEDYLQRAGSGAFPGPFRYSWSVPYPDADRYLHPLFHTSGIGTTNLSGYSSVRFDELIVEEARRAGAIEDRRLLYQQAEDLLCEDLPLIPVVQENRSYVVRSERLASAADAYAGGPRGELLLRELYVSD